MLRGVPGPQEVFPPRMSSRTIARFLEVGPHWLAVETDLPAVHSALEFNFGSRYAQSPSPGCEPLVCRVSSDPDDYLKAAGQLHPGGPEVSVSPGISIRYALSAATTWLDVTRTAL